MANETNEPDFVAATLEWCNEHRVEQGLDPLGKLPKGTPGNGYSCPCGKATGLYVGILYWKHCGRQYSVHSPLPEPVAQFVRAFDAGELPWYELMPGGDEV